MVVWKLLSGPYYQQYPPVCINFEADQKRKFVSRYAICELKDHWYNKVRLLHRWFSVTPGCCQLVNWKTTDVKKWLHLFVLVCCAKIVLLKTWKCVRFRLEEQDIWISIQKLPIVLSWVKICHKIATEAELLNWNIYAFWFSFSSNRAFFGTWKMLRYKFFTKIYMSGIRDKELKMYKL